MGLYRMFIDFYSICFLRRTFQHVLWQVRRFSSQVNLQMINSKQLTVGPSNVWLLLVRGLWKSPVINSTEFGEIDRNSQQFVLVSPWIYLSALINNIFLLSNMYLDSGLDSRLVRLRNGKLAACNHRITDARGRLLRLRSADVFLVIACDDRKYVCASQGRGCLAPKKRKSCKRW